MAMAIWPPTGIHQPRGAKMNTLRRWGWHGLVATLAAAIAACGGGSDPPAAPPAALRLDSAASVTQSIGPAGGTLSTTGADGTAYTLTVPAKALRSATAITLTPIASIADLPSGVSLAGGAHLTPEGQTFSVPLKLTIALAAAPTSAPLPFTYDGELQQRHLYPATVSGSTIEFEIVHFSGYAAFLGELEALQELFGSLEFFSPPSARGDQALQELVNAATGGLGNDARAAAMGAALRDWLDDAIKPAVVAAQAIGSYDLGVFELGSVRQLHIELNIFDIALRYAVVAGAGSQIDDVMLDFRVAVRDAARHVIAVSNAGCDAANALAFLAPDILRWQALAQRTGAAALDPTLERAAVLEELCVQVAYDPNGGLDFPTGIQPGEAGTLGVRAGYSIKGGPVRFDEPLFMVLTGASNVEPSGVVDAFAVAAGATLQQQFRWEPATIEMRIDVDACLANELLREVCQQAFVVRGVSSVPPPPSGTCPSYSATAAGTTVISGDFRLGASSEFRSNVDPDNVALSFVASASSRDRNRVAASANNTSAAATATVFYTVDEFLESGAPISFVVTWHGNAEIEVGSVTATFTINNDSRTDTAVGSRPLPLQIPVTAKHGDILKITTAVTASSSSSAGFSLGARVTGSVGGGVLDPGLELVPVICN
jgi:hypothetical protein